MSMTTASNQSARRQPEFQLLESPQGETEIILKAIEEPKACGYQDILGGPSHIGQYGESNVTSSSGPGLDIIPPLDPLKISGNYSQVGQYGGSDGASSS
jgi:hypothetical protein